MSNCNLCKKPCWLYKDRFCSLYCEDCRVADIAESYVDNLAIKSLVEKVL